MGLPALAINKEPYTQSYHEIDIKKVYVKNESSWYSGFTNYYITSKDYQYKIFMINISGYDSAAKGIASTLLKGGSIYIENDVYSFCGKARMFKQKIDKYTNILLVSENFIYSSNYTSYFLLNDNESVEDRVFKILKENYTVPILKEWDICSLLEKEGFLKKFLVYSANPDYPKHAYSLTITESALTNLITTHVKDGKFKINGPDEDLSDIQTLDDYLLRYGQELTAKVVDKNKPLFVPGEDEYPEHIKHLKRAPIGMQNDVIAAAAKKLTKDKSVIINGEMGTGKTLLGSAIPYVTEQGKPTRVLVMCPGHLVHKWHREIKDTVPGAKTFTIRSIADLKNIKNKPSGIEYYIMSKDRAKLGYSLKPGVVYKKSGKNSPGYFCPRCGKKLQRGLDLLTFDAPRKSNYKCPSCGEVLWQADNTQIRRYPPAKYIAKYLKGYFDYLIADEVHELKGETAQGTSFGQLTGVTRKNIALTGTLSGGYASNLFYILCRMFTQKMARCFRYDQLKDFIAHYGFIERQYENVKISDAELNTTSFGIKGKLVNTREIPGISPMILPHFLMDSVIYISLADLQIRLPDYTEEVRLVEMKGLLKEAYKRLEDDLYKAILECLRSGSRALLSSYLVNLLSYADRPFNNNPIIRSDTGDIVCLPQELPQNELYPKEKELLRLVKDELSNGRRVFIYVQYTDKRDTATRLQKILSDHNIPAAVLRSKTVKQEKREEWINKKVVEGIKVIIANPELVKTGLDLLAFPTIVFYQCGYSLYTLMQAARRSWRIGQDHDVRVYFFAYKDTMQEKALQLMGRKYEASMVVNGKFSLEGLAQMAEDESMVVALAKALAGKINVKDSAESIWKRLYGKKTTFAGSTPKPAMPEMPKQGQLNIFALYQYKTETKCKKEQKQKVAVGQLSLYDLL